MKKNFLSFIVLLFTMLFSTVSLASTGIVDDPLISYEKYQELKSDGIIGDDVSFEDLQELQRQSIELEKKLENSADFVDVTDEVLSTRSTSTSLTSLKIGDVIVTNGTSFAGFLGHAGIAISSSEILHIAGPNEVPKVLTISSFKAKYLKDQTIWIKVYRSINASAASKAGAWAKNTYQGSGATYKITTNLTSTNETYCSKIVWQAYYYGAGSSHVESTLTIGFRLPYGLPTSINNLGLEGYLSN